MLKSRSVIRSSRAVHKRKKKLVTRIVAVCLCSIALLFGVALASHGSSFTIAEVRVEGIASVSEADVRTVVDEKLQGSYFALFARKNSWLYPKDVITKAIQENFPQVAAVSVSASPRTVLNLSITEREPYALWCSEVEGAGCYFIDNEGFVFVKAPDFTGHVYTVFTGRIEVENPIGNFYLKTEEFTDLQEFLTSLQSLKLKPQKVHLSESGDGQVMLLGTGKILFTFGPEVNKNITNLSSFLSEIKLVNVDGGIKAQYIDIRFGNKIFYKE